MKADAIWQAVRVPPGEHVVRFHCRRAVAGWMWAAMLLGIAAVVALRRAGRPHGHQRSLPLVVEASGRLESWGSMLDGTGGDW